MKKIIAAALAASILAGPAYACSSTQRSWLEGQITETENNIALNESAPDSSRALNYPQMRPRLRALYHAMQKCDDSTWSD